MKQIFSFDSDLSGRAVLVKARKHPNGTLEILDMREFLEIPESLKQKSFILENEGSK